MRFLFLILFVSCTFEKQPKAQGVPLLDIFKKAEFYKSQIKFDSHGWLPDTKCDGLLFNSLAVWSGLSVPIFKARDDKTGRWYRYPSKDCHSNSESSSSISRDMLLGLLFYVWETKDDVTINRLIDYGEQNGWVFGEGTRSRTWINPGMRSTMYQIRYKLNGTNHGGRHVPQIWGNQGGYQRHLRVLHIYLRWLINDNQFMDTYDYYILDRDKSDQERNALIQAVFYHVTGKRQYYDRAVKILRDESLFPSGRLPSTNDRCEFYLWQRDQTSKSWKPCDRGKVWSGIDFFVVVKILKAGTR